MRSIRRYFVFGLLTAIFLSLRIFFSDPWNASVATNDTASYVDTANLSIVSSAFYSGPRPITLPILFKIFTPPGGFDVSIRSEPSIGKTPGLLVLPGFNWVVFSQSVLSVLSWWLLALVLYRKIHNPWLRILTTSGILLSACLPEIVSWDHVLMSESLTFSLFALLLAISLVLFDQPFFEGRFAGRRSIFLSIAFLICMFLWVNTRDTNVYFLLVCMLILTIGLLIPWIQRRFREVPFTGIGILFVVLCIFVLQQTTAKASERMVNPIINNLVMNVFPYWTRVQFLHDRWGMPDSQDIISTTGSANYNGLQKNIEFVQWVHQKGMPAYMDFMIHTPLWTTQMLIDSINSIFGYYKQPYFDPYAIQLPIDIRPLSKLINWSSSDLILISFLLVISSFLMNLHEKNSANWPIIGIMTCLWVGAGLMYTASYLGETWGSATRHIQNTILTYRLIIFVFLPLQFDK
jgi:hypothetical protein